MLVLKVMAAIFGANVLLLILWCLVGALRMRGGQCPGKTACVRCGEPGAKYPLKNIEGYFCKHCWYEKVEETWFLQAGSDRTNVDVHPTVPTEVKG